MIEKAIDQLKLSENSVGQSAATSQGVYNIIFLNELIIQAY